MKRMKRIYYCEDGLGMLEISMLLGFVAIAIIIALFAANTGGAAVGAGIIL